MYAPNNMAPRYVKQKLTELQLYIDKLTIVLETSVSQ